MVYPGIFISGWVQAQLTEKSSDIIIIHFFNPQLYYRGGPMVDLKESNDFPRFHGRSTVIFPGDPTFSRWGWGIQLIIPMDTYRSCDFLTPLSTPSGSVHMAYVQMSLINIHANLNFCLITFLSKISVVSLGPVIQLSVPAHGMGNSLKTGIIVFYF